MELSKRDNLYDMTETNEQLQAGDYVVTEAGLLLGPIVTDDSLAIKAFSFTLESKNEEFLWCPQGECLTHNQHDVVEVWDDPDTARAESLAFIRLH